MKIIKYKLIILAMLLSGVPFLIAETSNYFKQDNYKLEFLKEEEAKTKDRLYGLKTNIRSEKLSQEEQLDLLLKKMELDEELELLASKTKLELTSRRYKKGLEIIRLLYEKIMGMDHHFSSMKSFQDIAMLSNPNSYAGIQDLQDKLNKKASKKSRLPLPEILQSNPIISATHSLLGIMNTEGDPSTKKQELEDVSCILDFTVRMNNDLKVVSFEKEFLRKGNNDLLEECIQLFEEYTRAIGYKVPIDKCRQHDDWETINRMIDQKIHFLEGELQSDDPRIKERVFREQINMEFSVKRLMGFINSYSAFIQQGERYYKKFQLILASYENEDVCVKEIPRQFLDLRKDIDNTVDKFHEAYNVAEIKGSKLKDMLYGFSD